jgi:class 3 adenylate cyclase
VADEVCASCGAGNRAGAKFCAECGSSMVATCPHCGAPAAPGRFCTECGGVLNGSPAVSNVPGGTADPAEPAAATAPVAERRVVSLLFGDLVGFTPISESLDPEAVRELLSAYFDRARAIVERYGGTVEKFIGDAVFAVWGVPAAREDDAERSVRTGLDLVSMVAALGQEIGVESLQMRVGIATGQVAVTLGAVGEGMVAGDAVNTAARVQSVATPGEVWVDDPTRALTTASLAYEAAGSHELKGKSVPLELFRAVRTTAAVGGEQRVDGLEARFVGRDRELRMVKELFHATAEERRGRLVLVAGEPGIGKSRLAWEFEKYLDAITSHTSFWLRGRCLSYGQGVAGRVFAEMIRSLLRVTDTDDEATVRAALTARLEEHVPDAVEREVLRPRLESVLGLAEGSFDQADMFACWRGFLERLTDDSMVTLVVEDLQWADDGFFDFLDHLLDAAQGPIMVLALARPEVSARRPGIGAGRRATTVFLEPLIDSAMCELLDGLVGNLPEALRDELVRRADGIPLYAVETVRSLIDRDVVVPEGGRYVVDPAALGALDLSELAPPASLHALLAARLDALSADERRVVQDGSVLGLTFTRAGIEALTTTATPLDDVLASLRRKEILNVDTDPRSSERGQYRFVQALLRGVAYETLSRRDRKARHIAVAEHLATREDATSIAGVLAAHYLDAAAAVPEDDDSRELFARAAELLERAAEQAAEVGAPVDALEHYARLMTLDISDETRCRIALAATDLARPTGMRMTDVIGWLDAALGTVEPDQEELRLELLGARARLRLSGLLDIEGGQADAQEVIDASVGRPERVWLLANAAHVLGVSAQTNGDVALAERVATTALPDIERYGDDKAFALLLEVLGVWFGAAGYRRLNAVVRRAAGALADPRDRRAIAQYSNLAAGLMHDDPPAALRAAGRGRDAARALGINELTPLAHHVVASIYMGLWAEAEADLRRRPTTDLSEFVDWESFLVAGAAMLGWFKDDPSLVRPSIEGATDSGDQVMAAWGLMQVAVSTAFRDGAAAGAALAVEAVERVWSGLGGGSEDLPLQLSLAVEMLLESGDRDALERLIKPLEEMPVGLRYRLVDAFLHRARAHLSPAPADGLARSAELFDAMGAAFWAARTRVELAAALHDGGDPASAKTTLDAAEPLLREIGAARALREVDELRAKLAAAEAPVG